MDNVIIKNQKFKLEISGDCVAKSLTLLSTGEEFLQTNENLPLFSITEERPYNNEIKLTHITKKTVFNANSIERDKNILTVGFELIKFKAKIEINEKPDYVSFKLLDFIVKPEDFEGLSMTPPPVFEFGLLQLPVKNKTNFGEWLNVCHDSKTAIGIAATSPYEVIDNQKRNGFRILTASASRDIKLKGCEAALIVSNTSDYLDAVRKLEYDYNLPKGVDSRRNEAIIGSVYWVTDLNPHNLDEHIRYAKMGGFRNIMFFYTSIFKEENTFDLCGNYDFKDEYKNGFDDLKAVLKKIKSAGLKPGIHFLHSHIGKSSRYITPVADHRLNLKKIFTLSHSLSPDDTEIFVEENPEGCVMYDECRVLKFGGELIHYEGYTGEYPYKFTGCRRGHWNTNITCHNVGEMGGLLDVSEFGATSVYINQNTSLQDEIAQKLADVYNCGFEFVYFDGSEGTNPPFDFNIPYAQYRVYKKFVRKPDFCEGAAKGHFSWHILSGGNAYDVFGSDVFKKKIAEHPLKAAQISANDFTAVDFGWWDYYIDAQPDMYEYATSHAAGCDCHGTLKANLSLFEKNPRNADVFEVIRRWETIRQFGILTDEQKAKLRDENREHILLINEKNEYEIAECFEIEGAAGGNESVRAFCFERNNKSYAVCWHKTASGQLKLPADSKLFVYEDEIGKANLPVLSQENGSVIQLEGRRYLSGNISLDKMKEIFVNSLLF